MAQSCAPTTPRPTPQPSRRDRALLAAVAAGRGELTTGTPPTLLIDHRAACDQLAAYQLVANGLIEPAHQRGRADSARLTPAGEAVHSGLGPTG